MEEYIVITTNYNNDLAEESNALDTAFVFYRNGYIDTIAYFSRNEIEDSYVNDYLEGTEVTGGAKVHNFVVEGRDQVLNGIHKLINIYYDFEDFTVFLLWNDVTNEIIGEMNELANISDEDQKFAISKFKDIIEGVFDMENLCILHDVHPDLYEDETNVLGVNLAHGSILKDILVT